MLSWDPTVGPLATILCLVTSRASQGAILGKGLAGPSGPWDCWVMPEFSQAQGCFGFDNEGVE